MVSYAVLPNDLMYCRWQ